MTKGSQVLDYIFLILVAIVGLFFVFKRRDEWKEKLSKLGAKQIVGIVLVYVVTLVVVFVLIYFGGNYLANLVTNETGQIVVKILILFFVLTTCVGILNKVVTKISKGVL